MVSERPEMPPPTAGWSDRGSTRTSSTSSSRAGAGAGAGGDADPFARIVEGENVGVALPAGAIHPGTGISSWSTSSSSRGLSGGEGAGASTSRGAIYKSLSFRRTLIPILLTLGLALPGLAAWWWTLDDDAPLKHTGAVVPITLVVTGVVLLLLAVLNMLQVRHQLLRRAPA